MTIKDVAREAGVSSAAVSRYFNGGSLSEDKKEKISKVVEKNHYVPNQTAQSMRTGKSGQIGVIIPKINSESFSQIMKGIAKAMDNSDYNLILGCTYEKQEKEVEYIESMQSNKMEGILLMGTIMTPYLATAIKKCKVPIVVTGQNFENVPCVYFDDKNALSDMTRLMLRKRKKLAYIGVTEDDLSAGKARKQGVERALEEAGIDKASLITRISDFSMEGGYEAMKSLLDEGVLVDGVICATDLIAHGAMQAIKEAGKKIPRDISLAGVGNSWADTISEPELTTVMLFYEECGKTAFSMLKEMIDSPEKKHVISRVMLGYEIIERGSI